MKNLSIGRANAKEKVDKICKSFNNHDCYNKSNIVSDDLKFNSFSFIIDKIILSNL